MDFEWDIDKAVSNLAKHGVSFGEAETVFGDPLARTFLETVHSIDEERLVTIGLTENDNLVLVCHTDRGNSTRIISARHATTKERKAYESS